MSVDELKKGRHKCTLDLGKITLDDKMGCFLATLIEENDPTLKHIVTINNTCSENTIERILTALKKNSYITQFNFNYENASLKQEIYIKTQLMLNKALKYIMPLDDDKASTFWKIIAFLRSTFALMRGFTGMIILQFSKFFSWQTITASTLIYQGLIKFVADPYFKSEYLKIKQENTTVASLNSNLSYLLGKRCTTETLVWAHPLSWTPLGYLGYQVAKKDLEKEKLSQALLNTDNYNFNRWKKQAQ